MDAHRFALMKPRATFVNVSRRALGTKQRWSVLCAGGHPASAGLDAFAEEPISPDRLLLTFNDVVVTSHIANYTKAGHHRVWETTIR
jgi:phosphoglycerate dehydrogenase-like enzyme